MPSGNRADRRTGLVALSNDLRLLFRGPAPAPTGTGEHFQVRFPESTTNRREIPS
jgi:hypothetical protein